MTRGKLYICTCVLVAGLLGCGTTPATPPDADVGTDAGVEIDAAVDIDAGVDAPPTEPSATFQTAGGGAATSASFRVELRIGAPQPMGSAASASYAARLGPTNR